MVTETNPPDNASNTAGGMQMVYVMSDIHGEYNKYRRMLEKIRFSDDDIMYILGDVVDRGPEPAKILLDMMKRKNVVPLLGNHEAMAYPVLEKLADKDFDFNKIDKDTMDAMRDWIDEGGWETIESFRELPIETCRDILDYMNYFFVLIQDVEVNGRTFTLVHAGLGSRKRRIVRKHDLIWSRPNPHIRYIKEKNSYLVCGHTPTCIFGANNRIYRCRNNIFIDCAAVFGGRLGCLCLDNFKEYYM
jgi:serine/threonine protein phosphatase 1